MFSPDLGSQRVSRTACPDNRAIFLFAKRISPLHKIVWKNSVKRGLHVKTVLHQLLEIGSGLRSGGVKKSDREAPRLAFFPLSPLNIENRNRIRKTARNEQNQRGEQNETVLHAGSKGRLWTSTKPIKELFRESRKTVPGSSWPRFTNPSAIARPDFLLLPTLVIDPTSFMDCASATSLSPRSGKISPAGTKPLK